MAATLTASRPLPLRNPIEFWRLFQAAFAEWRADKAPRLGAALAYYTVFSLAPLLVIALAIAAFAFGQEAANREVNTQLQGLLGDDGAKAVNSLLENAQQPKLGAAAALLGILSLLFGATGVFVELQDSLNTVWKTKPKPTSGLWSFIRTRFLSLAMVLGVGFLLLVSLLLSAAVSGVAGYVGGWLGNAAWLMQTLNVLASLIVVTLLFAMIFKWLPDEPIAWRDVWLGAALTAILFTIGKQLIGMYLGRASVASAYGAAGSVVIILLWAYYSAQILLFGAEFTKVFAQRFGSKSSQRSEQHASTST